MLSQRFASCRSLIRVAQPKTPRVQWKTPTRSFISAKRTSVFASSLQRVQANSTIWAEPRNCVSRSWFHSSLPTRATGPRDKVSADGTVQFYLADIGEGIAECEILRWNIKEGDRIQQFDKICEVQSDKATVEITSRYDGIVTKLHYKKGDMAKVGTPLVEIKLDGHGGGGGADAKQAHHAPAPSQASHTAHSTEPRPATPASSEQILASPATRHLARQHNIPLSSISGSGRGGMIVKEDILKIINGSAPAVPPTQTRTPAPSTPPVQGTAQPRPKSVVSGVIPEDRVVTLSGYSRIMAKTMAATVTVPHFGYSDEVIVDELINAREELKALASKKGIKFSYMPLIIKAASLALQEYPMLNAHYDDAKNTLTHKGAHNIGVAVDSPNGLIVPNIKNVQTLTLLQIAEELNRLHEAALKAAVSKEDLTGGTFTFSNIGTIGGTYASPVLVLPEVVIGAIGKFQRVPRFDEEDNVVPVNIMNISWSADHRVVDGATMASFSNLWKQYLENPSSMLLNLR